MVRGLGFRLGRFFYQRVRRLAVRPSRALRADAEELQLVIKIAEAGFLADFVLKLVDGTRRFDGLDAAAARADQVVAVFPGNQQGEVSRALMKTEPPDDSVSSQSLEQAENSGLVALVGEALGAGQFR